MVYNESKQYLSESVLSLNLIRKSFPKGSSTGIMAPSQEEGWMTIPLPDGRWPSATHGRSRKTSTFRWKAAARGSQGHPAVRVGRGQNGRGHDPRLHRGAHAHHRSGDRVATGAAQSAGRVRFDIDEGRVLGQQMDIDKPVVGFRGDASSIHYVNRYTRAAALETGDHGRKAGQAGLNRRDDSFWGELRSAPTARRQMLRRKPLCRRC